MPTMMVQLTPGKFATMLVNKRLTIEAMLAMESSRAASIPKTCNNNHPGLVGIHSNTKYSSQQRHTTIIHIDVDYTESS